MLNEPAPPTHTLATPGTTSEARYCSAPIFLWWATLLLGLAAFWQGWYINRFGVDIESDSAVYISAGIRFAHGAGVSWPNRLGNPEPMNHFPPGWPMLIAVLEWLGLNLRLTIGTLHAAAWSLLTMWVGYSAWCVTRVRPLGLLAAGTILTCQALRGVYSYAYSDPEWYLYMMAALWCLACWLRRPSYLWTLATAACLAAAQFTRYATLGLIVIAGLLILLRFPKTPTETKTIPWWQRGLMAGLLGLLSLGPLAAYNATHHAENDSAMGRHLVWHLIDATQIREGVQSVASYLVPVDLRWSYSAQAWAVVGTVAFFVGCSIWARQRIRNVTQRNLTSPPTPAPLAIVLDQAACDTPEEAVHPLARVCGWFIPIYLGILVLSMSITDPPTSLDPRILSILLPTGTIAACFLLGQAFWNRGAGQFLWRISVLGPSLLLLTLHGTYNLKHVLERTSPTTLAWWDGTASETLDAVRELAADETIYSNDPPVIFLITRQRSEFLPDPLPSHQDDATIAALIRARLELMRQTLNDGGGYVVYWNQLNLADPTISLADLKTFFPEAQVQEYSDGVVLYIKGR